MRASVLGMGSSLLTYKEIDHKSDIIVGVNDVGKYHKLDYLILVDPPTRFNKERLHTIINTDTSIITIFSEWKRYFDFIYLVKPAQIRSDLSLLDSDYYVYSISSPFVAVVHAYKLGASEIVMYGVDFTTHKALSKPNKLKRIQRDFYNLRMELEKRNVRLYIGSPESALNSFIPVY